MLECIMNRPHMAGTFQYFCYKCICVHPFPGATYNPDYYHVHNQNYFALVCDIFG